MFSLENKTCTSRSNVSPNVGEEWCRCFVDIIEQVDGAQAEGHQQQINPQGLEKDKKEKYNSSFVSK